MPTVTEALNRAMRNSPRPTIGPAVASPAMWPAQAAKMYEIAEVKEKVAELRAAGIRATVVVEAD
jgi:hypothetical protein